MSERRRCPLAQTDHVVSSAPVVEIRQIETVECSLRDLTIGGHDTKPLKFSGPNEVGSSDSIVNVARTPSGPHA